jgi:hypothetical protein
MFLIFLSLVAGAFLGTRFRIWSLLPATVLVFLSVALLDWHDDAGLLQALMHALLISFCLQIGYLFGLFAARLRRPKDSRHCQVAAQ